jgi:uncharacterized membrane protein
MGFWLLLVLQWLHILFAIAWFGGSVAANFLVTPAAALLPAGEQAGWWKAFSGRTTGYFASVAGATIVFGIARGIAGGVLSILTSAYGLTWIAALVLAIAVAVWGARVTNPTTARIATSTSSDLAVNLAAANRAGRIELGGFLVIFTLMIAMHFGY